MKWVNERQELRHAEIYNAWGKQKAIQVILRCVQPSVATSTTKYLRIVKNRLFQNHRENFREQ